MSEAPPGERSGNFRAAGIEGVEMESPRQSWTFLAAYAFAWAGGSIAYVPFLTILLPSRISHIYEGNAAVWWLSALTFSGAIVASLANIGAGLASDLTRSRRPWIAAGLAINLFTLLQFSWVEKPLHFLGFIVLWQLSLNMVLAPLAAWAGDCVPDSQKGTLGGMLAFAPALGALSSVAVTAFGSDGLGTQLPIVGAFVLVSVLPVLLLVTPRAVEATRPARSVQSKAQNPLQQATVLMWLARFLVQLAESSLFAFLLIFFRSVRAGVSETSVASLFAVVLTVAVPIALAVGRWSDRERRPIMPLAICAAIGGGGLLVMANSRALLVVSGGYLLFGTAIAVFLSLHAGQTLRVLPRPDRRGRDLGFFNLTNTLPSIVMPVFALSLIPTLGFSAMLALLAGLSFVAASLLAILARRPLGREAL